MTILVAIFGAILLLVGAVALINRRKAEQEITRFSVTPADLRALLDKSDSPLVVNVRLPLDLLDDPHIIPGSIRIAPKEVQSNPALVPRNKDIVFYCTCPSDGTSRQTLQRRTRRTFVQMGLAGTGELLQRFCCRSDEKVGACG